VALRIGATGGAPELNLDNNLFLTRVSIGPRVTYALTGTLAFAIDSRADGLGEPGDVVSVTFNVTNTSAVRTGKNIKINLDNVFNASWDRPLFEAVPNSFTTTKGVLNDNRFLTEQTHVLVSELAPGESVQIRFRARLVAFAVRDVFTRETPFYTFTASVIDSLPRSDSLIARVPLRAFIERDVAISVSVETPGGADRVSDGDILNYTIVLTNTGVVSLPRFEVVQQSSRMVAVLSPVVPDCVDILSPTITSTSGTISRTDFEGYDEFTVSVATFAPGDTLRIRFQARVDQTYSPIRCARPEQPIGISSTTAQFRPEPPSNLLTNPTRLAVVTAASFPHKGLLPSFAIRSIKTSAGRNEVAVGERVTYTVNITNISPVALRFIEMLDSYDACISVLTSTLTSTQGTVGLAERFAGSGLLVVRGQLGTLEPNARAQVQYAATVWDAPACTQIQSSSAFYYEGLQVTSGRLPPTSNIVTRAIVSAHPPVTTPTPTPTPSPTPAPSTAGFTAQIRTDAGASLPGVSFFAVNQAVGDAVTAQSLSNSEGRAAVSVPGGGYRVCAAIPTGYTNVTPSIRDGQGNACYWFTIPAGATQALGFVFKPVDVTGPTPPQRRRSTRSAFLCVCMTMQTPTRSKIAVMSVWPAGPCRSKTRRQASA
jgi:uncharacterized repeat protein (TIGR01451 family)